MLLSLAIMTAGATILEVSPEEAIPSCPVVPGRTGSGIEAGSHLRRIRWLLIPAMWFQGYGSQVRSDCGGSAGDCGACIYGGSLVVPEEDPEGAAAGAARNRAGDRVPDRSTCLLNLRQTNEGAQCIVDTRVSGERSGGTLCSSDPVRSSPGSKRGSTSRICWLPNGWGGGAVAAVCGVRHRHLELESVDGFPFPEAA